ncbi:TRAP-type C4-dicarboxylate transport system permease small subunit [Amorphus suaedae]
MRILQFGVFALSRLSAVLAALILIGMVGHVLFEIILRTFFATSTFVLSEFVGYGVAAVTFLSLGYALEHGSLIRVNLLIGRLEGRALRVFECLSALGALFVVSVLIRFFWISVERNWVRGRVSSSIAEVPMWIPEGLVLVGLAVFWLQLVAYFLRQVTDTAPPVAPDDAGIPQE